MNNNKNLLRAHFLALRGAIAAQEAARAAQRVSDTLSHYVTDAVSGIRCVCGYAAIRGEIDLLPFMRSMAQRGFATCLPVAQPAGTLVFKHWKPGDDLQKGLFNIDVPAEKAPEAVPDLVVAPLLAFDRLGHRLGYGGGYYDRAIAGLRAAGHAPRIIGAAYSCQRTAEPFAEPHDERLDAVATEDGLIECVP